FRFKPLEVIFDIFAITLAAQALTLPIIAANFSQVSVIAPITNLLVLWSLPFVIMVILGGLGLSLLIPSLAILFFLPAKILLDYVIFIAEKLARLPYAYFEINYVWPVWWGLYYIIMAWLIFRFKSKKRKKNF
ncbi:MAG: ComEC/Rec2 family competence protein, partial [Patescibacteria group bacterium]|nr:ComEC/Rec2 family competence protein [Patescibacteria group bacterium]